MDYETDKWICTVFNLRTITSEALLGEPALEGVHSDGVDHTMTTLLKHNNMTNDSAKTFIHSMKEVNSTKWSDTNPEYLLGTHQHLNYLDTLIIVDHERKHSLSPVHAVNQDKEALRDMLIFFTRKPTTESHVSYPYDSKESHPDYPINLKLPELELNV
ncbi:2OG-Fe dioxygenase family protein [Catenovulum sp. 2E275]|uniref:2OG-Fe dioxygenase family protein n=1 Tax=Catenovulum sp. 2E275 TaxID=2980497 RepID=UPI0021CDFAC6|nr:2OG-Fe dioxygenase family protein [Catenovulum sp. 2E275]MCU4677549.1 2OG-Fe dioxygenase family protein [Catenovulum sp. 2E275]